VIEEILPPEVATAEAFDDAAPAVLFPAEEAAIARAVPKRRREFTTGRACARAALAKLGLPPAPIVPGLRGAPQWPAGVTGSRSKGLATTTRTTRKNVAMPASTAFAKAARRKFVVAAAATAAEPPSVRRSAQYSNDPS